MCVCACLREREGVDFIALVLEKYKFIAILILISVCPHLFPVLFYINTSLKLAFPTLPIC